MSDKVYLKNRPKSESPAVRKALKEALGDKKKINPILALFTKKGRKAWKAELKHALTPTLEAEEKKQYGSSPSLASAKLKKKKRKTAIKHLTNKVGGGMIRKYAHGGEATVNGKTKTGGINHKIQRTGKTYNSDRY